MKKYLLLFLLSFGFIGSQFAQVYSDKLIEDENFEQELDSLRAIKDYSILPIFGKQVRDKGFDLPYSAGLSVNYLYQQSDILIDKLQVGFNNGPLIPMDEFFYFDEAISRANGFNVRPDFWLFPFLNVYGIFAYINGSTEIDGTISVPNQDGYEDLFDINSTVEFAGTSAGFGITPTVGIGGVWMAVDMNFTWTDFEQLDEPAYAFVLGPRIGKTFNFRKPEQNLSVWAGGFRIALNSDDSGSLRLDDVFEFNGEFEQKIDNGLMRVEQKQIEVEEWWQSLTPPQQALNRPRYNALNRVLGAANNFLEQLNQARDNVTNSTVQYSLDKRQKKLWNFVLGAQYQFNKHWMFRAEVGFLGARTQVISGLQYRFKL